VRDRREREREREREDSNNTKREGRGGPSRVLLREPSILVLTFQKFFLGQLLHVLGFFKAWFFKILKLNS
jgi:hypothetical protein